MNSSLDRQREPSPQYICVWECSDNKLTSDGGTAVQNHAECATIFALDSIFLINAIISVSSRCKLNAVSENFPLLTREQYQRRPLWPSSRRRTNEGLTTTRGWPVPLCSHAVWKRQQGYNFVSIWQATVVPCAWLVVTLYRPHSTSPSPTTVLRGSNNWASSQRRRLEILLIIMANRAPPSGLALDIRRKVSSPLFPLNILSHQTRSITQYSTLITLHRANPLLVLFNIYGLFTDRSKS